MLAKYQRIFQLYFSQHSCEEVGRMMGISDHTVRSILLRYGEEWVANYLKLEHKQRLLELSQEGKNSEQIAKEMKWSRWLVTWTLRRLLVTEILKPTRTIIPESRALTFRCSVCSSNFIASLPELSTNPDRICPNCEDRRKGDRRTINREEPNADDDAQQSCG